MKKVLLNALLFAALGMVSLSTGAAKPVSIGNYGDDGDETYHEVTCSDNSRGTVIEKRDPKQVCAYPANGQARCNKNWTVKKAAEHACK